MYVLRDNQKRLVTGFSKSGGIHHDPEAVPLKWDSLINLVKFLRGQPAVEPFIVVAVSIHRIIEQPLEIVTEEVV